MSLSSIGHNLGRCPEKGRVGAGPGRAGPVKSLQSPCRNAYNLPHREAPDGRMTPGVPPARGRGQGRVDQYGGRGMSSTLMMERTGMGMPGMGVPGMGVPTMGPQTGAPTSGNYVMVPRCTLKFEKCAGG